MPITDWPVDDKPREKLLKKGPSALSDAELLAIQLRIGIKGKSAVDLARDLLKDHGGLAALLNADHHRFCQTSGVGVSKYAQLQASLELARRYLYEVIERGDAIVNPEQAKNYILSQLKGRHNEVFACLFLDAKNRLLCFEELFTGTINSANVYPRIVIKKILQHNAAAVIFAHNHPSGDPKPSAADQHITKVLQDCLQTLDVRVIDHVIIGESGVFSFAEKGLL